MQPTPEVSIIVPNYNHAKYLKQRLDSIFNQTYKNFEVILLDDKSTDNSIEVLDSYQDERITHRVYNTTNSGSPFLQWKKGLELATAKLIWIAESDDVADSTFLEKMFPIFEENQNVAVAYCDLINIDEKGNKLGNLHLHYNHDAFGQNDHYEEGIDFLKKHMFIGNSIVNASGVIFQKKLGLKHINKIIEYRTAGDWLFWNNILAEKEAYVYFKGTEKLNYFRHSLQSTRNYNSVKKREIGDIEAINVTYETSIFTKLDEDKVRIRRRQLLDRWMNNHSFKDIFTY